MRSRGQQQRSRAALNTWSRTRRGSTADRPSTNDWPVSVTSRSSCKAGPQCCRERTCAAQRMLVASMTKDGPRADMKESKAAAKTSSSHRSMSVRCTTCERPSRGSPFTQRSRSVCSSGHSSSIGALKTGTSLSVLFGQTSSCNAGRQDRAPTARSALQHVKEVSRGQILAIAVSWDRSLYWQMARRTLG